MIISTVRVLGVVSLLTIVGCKQQPTDAPAPTNPPPSPVARDAAVVSVAHARLVPPSEPGTWFLAHLVYADVGILPFFLHVPPVGKNTRSFVINGDELVEMKTDWRDNEVTITGPWNYTSTIEADLDKSGNLKGTWTRQTGLWGNVEREFTASPIPALDETIRFPKVEEKTHLDVAGTWQFQFAEHKEGKGQLEEDANGVVRGYIKPGQLGDIRFLAGNVGGGKLSLSQFNGNSANLILADVSADGKSMTGLMSMQNVWNEKFTAKKVDDFVFANKVQLKAGKTTVTLKGLDKYKGKPTLAIIFATWCPSCNDAHPYLEQLYATYHPQGLEVLGVAYDLFTDQKGNVAQLDLFRAKYKIPWELTQVPCTPETWAKAMPPELEGWDGFPILMLVKPDGTVQTVQGGWFGPATGADGEKYRKAFDESTKALVEAAKKG